MRSDIEEKPDPKLANTLKQHRIAIESKDHETTIDGKDGPKRIATRRAILESKEQDPNGIERVLGTSDLCSINFLERGLRAAASVARLRVRLKDGSGEWFGTGFLVAPNLLMTNHHVVHLTTQVERRIPYLAPEPLVPPRFTPGQPIRPIGPSLPGRIRCRGHPIRPSSASPPRRSPPSRATRSS